MDCGGWRGKGLTPLSRDVAGALLQETLRLNGRQPIPSHPNFFPKIC